MKLKMKIKGLRFAALCACGVCLGGAVQAQDTATWNFATQSNANTFDVVGGKNQTSWTYYNNGASDTVQNKYAVTAYAFYTSHNYSSSGGYALTTVGQSSNYTDSTGVYLYNAWDTKPTDNETGLGLYDTNHARSDKEIDMNHFIQLDVSTLQAAGFSTFTFGIGSGQVNEGFRLYGSNTLGQEGTLLYQDWNTTGKTANQGLSATANLKDNYKYYSITAFGNPSVTSIYLEDGFSVNNTNAFGGGGGVVPSLASVTPEGSSAAMLVAGLIPVAIYVMRRRPAAQA